MLPIPSFQPSSDLYARVKEAIVARELSDVFLVTSVLAFFDRILSLLMVTSTEVNPSLSFTDRFLSGVTNS
jgi:hypothetical protein